MLLDSVAGQDLKLRALKRLGLRAHGVATYASFMAMLRQLIRMRICSRCMAGLDGCMDGLTKARSHNESMQRPILHAVMTVVQRLEFKRTHACNMFARISAPRIRTYKLELYRYAFICCTAASEFSRSPGHASQY